MTKLFRKGNTSPLNPPGGGKKVLILGSGFGGTTALQCLVRGIKRDEDIELVMVSEDAFFQFSPMLHEAATGFIEPTHITYPLRKLQRGKTCNFIKATVQEINLGNHQVSTTAGNIDFDYLVLALGGVPNKPASCTSENGRGNVFTLNTLHDSISIKNHIIEMFERASKEQDAENKKQLLTFIVSGGGYTGTQLVAELRDFVFKDLPGRYKTINQDDIRVILIESGSGILAQSHPRFAGYADRYLRRKGVEIKLGSSITDIGTGLVKINGSEPIATSTVICTTGIISSLPISDPDVKKDSAGRILASEYLEVSHFPGVFATGDCAHIKDPKTGQPIPSRAHNAVRQAKIVAHNILAGIRGMDKKPYKYSNPFELVTLGTYNGMFRFNGFRIYGFPARFIGAAGYSLLITGASNRINIMVDRLRYLVSGRNTKPLE